MWGFLFDIYYVYYKKNIMAILSEKINGTLIEVSITSSNLRSAKYDTTNESLLVEFNNGSIYEYKSVPWNIFTKFRMAESQGKYFNTEISKKYMFQKVS
jgi:hypothetical protein